jgi:transposase
VLGPAELDMLHRLVGQEGVSVAKAARRLKIGWSTAYEALAVTRRSAPAFQPK